MQIANSNIFGTANRTALALSVPSVSWNYALGTPRARIMQCRMLEIRALESSTRCCVVGFFNPYFDTTTHAIIMALYTMNVEFNYLLGTPRVKLNRCRMLEIQQDTSCQQHTACIMQDANGNIFSTAHRITLSFGVPSAELNSLFHRSTANLMQLLVLIQSSKAGTVPD